MTLENEHHHVAAAYAQRLKERGRAVALAPHVGKGEAALAAMVVGPEHGNLVGVLVGPGVDNVVSEVEILRNLHAEILHEIVVRLKGRTAQKPFNHNFTFSYLFGSDYSGSIFDKSNRIF